VDSDHPKAEAPEHQPLIIKRSQHSISRKNIDPDALKVLYRLHRHGFTAYLVGGSVRDLQVGRTPKDFDVGTDARPSQVRKLFGNSRIIGKRFRLVQVFFRGGKIIEVSTFRRLANQDDDQVLTDNNTFGSPAEDAFRRDLTINALFYNIADFSIVDYVGGMADLQAGLIRGVGDPDLRFHRDPVRVLRAVRHAARQGFKLTPETAAAVDAHRAELSVCPLSRVRDELMRDLTGGAAAAWLELAHETGVLYTLLPDLEPFYGENAELRSQVVKLLDKVDKANSGKLKLSEAVSVAALLWPALVASAEDLPLEPGASGRVRWTLYTRETLPGLTGPVGFAKRVVERASQISGTLGVTLQENPGERLPKKIVDKGYFSDACRFAELMDFDLAAMADGESKSSRGRSRRRRRRPRRRPRAEKTGGESKPPTGSN
jgi:poly(A) polymerase